LILLTLGLAGEPATVEWPECKSGLECASHSVVSILPVHPPANRSEEPEGSGVVIGTGKLIATADHVIGNATRVLVRTITGHVLNAEIILRDKTTDVALLEISRALKPIAYGAKPRMGDSTCAIGNSFGLGISMACGIVSAQHLSGTGFNIIEDFVQTDAAVNPGMSGGALVNDKGELIGLLSAIFTKKSDSNIGVNFAVSSSLLDRVVQDFQQNGKLTRRKSGLVISPSLGKGEAGVIGARVTGVIADSQESRDGVLVGDIILFANEMRIKRAGSYQAALALMEKDNIVLLDILRDGERKKITINFD